MIDFVIVLGNTLDIGTPSDSTVTQAKTNFVSTSSSAGLQIKGDSTTPGTLQLNCEQNSHGIKLRSPAHSSGQSYTLTLPTGNVTADKFLKVASVSGSGTTGIGQLSFADASGEYVKLAQTTASGDSTVSFDGYFSSTYDNYVFFLNGMYHSSAGQLYARFRVSNADVTTTDYAFHVGRGHRDSGTNYWEVTQVVGIKII